MSHMVAYASFFVYHPIEEQLLLPDFLQVYYQPITLS